MAEALRTPETGPKSVFRYEPTLTAALPDGVAGSVVAEVGAGGQGQVLLIAAVGRPGQPPRVELWTFDQRNEREVLELVGTPAPILRTAEGDTPAEGLATLRRTIAAPGTTMRRRPGLAVSDAAALAGRLAELADTVRDGSATAHARAQALAQLCDGLDDRLLFELDAVASVLKSLEAGPWVLGPVEEVGARRRRTTTTGDSPRVLEFTRTGSTDEARWKLSGFDPARSPKLPAKP